MAQPAACRMAGQSSYPACTTSRHRTLGGLVLYPLLRLSSSLQHKNSNSDHILAVKKRENVSNRVGT